MEEQLLSVNGIQLGAILSGPQASSKSTLVLLHGFTGSASGWGELLEMLTRNGQRVIALDILGHGRSSAPASFQRYSIDHCRTDILAALEQLGIAPGEASLLGYSMGGRIALYTAFSGFFKSLILESASPGLVGEEAKVQRRASDEELATRIEHAGLEDFVNYWEHIPLFASQGSLPEPVRQELHRQRLRNNPTGLANSLRGVGVGSQPDLSQRLPELQLPVLLITGELDHKFNAIAQEMLKTLPQAEWRSVPLAGHTVHLEQPALFTTLVTSFLAQVGK